MSQPSPALRPTTFILRRRTPGTFVLVPCPKQGRSIRCQGQLEAATAQVLVACPLVFRIEEQPLKIGYAWEEQPHRVWLLDGPPTSAYRKVHRTSYIVPDFLVTMQDGRKRLIEVKPSAKLGRSDVERKFSVGRLFAERQGWSFHVVSDKKLFGGSLLTNVRLVNRFRRSNLDETMLGELATLVDPSGTSLGKLTQRVTAIDSATVRATALHLVAAGRLDLDPSVPFSETTLLFPGGTRPWDPFDSVWGPSGSSTSGPIASSDRRVPTNLSPKT